MPDEFNYTKPRDKYEQFANHIPIYTRALATQFLAESIQSPLFSIHFKLTSIILQIGPDSYRLDHDSTPASLEKYWIRDIPQPTIAIQQTLDEFDFKITFEGSGYFFTTTSTNRILKNEFSEEIASFANAWRDADAKKNIKHWIHCQNNIPTALLALFFYAAKTWTIPQRDTSSTSF